MTFASLPECSLGQCYTVWVATYYWAMKSECVQNNSFFFFLNGGEENRPEHNKVEKNVESIHCMYNNNRG